MRNLVVYVYLLLIFKHLFLCKNKKISVQHAAGCCRPPKISIVEAKSVVCKSADAYTWKNKETTRITKAMYTWLWLITLWAITLVIGEGNGTHSSTRAWKIPWMEEPGRLQSMGSLRVRHDWVTSLSLFTFMHWRRKWQPIPVFVSGESQGWGSLVGCRLWGRTEWDTNEVT